MHTYMHTNTQAGREACMEKLTYTQKTYTHAGMRVHTHAEKHTNTHAKTHTHTDIFVSIYLVLVLFTINYYSHFSLAACFTPNQIYDISVVRPLHLSLYIPFL